MTHKLKFVIPTLVLLTSCFAQEPLTIRIQGKQKPPTDAPKIYLPACSAVQREFGGTQALRPQLTLVMGGTANQADYGRREIRLRNGIPTCSPKVW